MHPTIGQRLRIAACGYAVSLVFGLALLTFHRMVRTLSPTEQLLMATAVALPLALALLWERLSKVKFGEVEITLVEVTPKIDFELANAIQDSRGSNTLQLITLIKTAIQSNGMELMEVNLRSKPYWWSTRLYLLAALAEEFTTVERLVFVQQQEARLYLGMASPRSVREALARKLPAVETVFRDMFASAGKGSTDPVEQVQTICYQWEQQSFMAMNDHGAREPVPEAAFKELVSGSNLFEWLGGSLETESREWDGSLPGRELYGKILSCDGTFVALVRCGRLERVVSKHALAQKIARSVLAS